MPARPGPRADQIAQEAASPGQILTAGLTVPSFEDNAGGGGGDVTAVETTTTISRDIAFTKLIGDGTPLPAEGTFGEFDTSVYEDGSDQGEKIEFTVPDDYVSGDVELMAAYRMTTSESAEVSFEVDVTIVDVTNGLTIISTSPTITQFMPTASTDVVRAAIVTLDEANILPGNVVVINLKRLGASPTIDTHSGDFEILRFSYRYTGAASAAAGSIPVSVFLEATGETPPANDFVGEVPVMDYPSGSDAGQKAIFTVPEDWDGTSDLQFKVTYYMSTAEDGGEVELETSGEIANTVDGTVDPLADVNFTLIPDNTTGPQRSVTVRTIPSSSVNVGDVIVMNLARRTGFTGNHSGIFRLVNMTMVIFRVTSGIGRGTSFTHLASGVFNPVSGLVNGDTDAPTLTGDFQTWDRMCNPGSSTDSGEIHVSYEGRIPTLSTQITSISVPIKGDGQYNLKIYVEDATTANPVYATGLAAAPSSRFVFEIDNTDLAQQPTGEKRFFVVVEAFLDPDEDVFVGLPFVRFD